MNTIEKNMKKTICNRRTYLTPSTEIIKMATSYGMMETLSIPRKDENTDEAYAKPMTGEMDMWDDGQ